MKRAICAGEFAARLNSHRLSPVTGRLSKQLKGFRGVFFHEKLRTIILRCYVYVSYDTWKMMQQSMKVNLKERKHEKPMDAIKIEY